ncbi:substrate-binding domain-containing protein [Archangium violaceum]|uniref:protein kinase domain-containing protein n=1 Tax=Archangium violaceum TaxID=83451 RepID=UPI00194E379A|nr:substrate-binding domain-containing protein [Archangium violaceum]QRO01350.1 substrate-binding domain-containing protein [Archangium violaceum]
MAPGNSAPAAPHAELGKYLLLATLGRGGMAEVFLALARGPVGFKKLVVIKKLRSDMTDQAPMVAMLLDEARLAARLHHPNVVQTLEVGENAAGPFIAMEYLDGQPLDKLIRATLRRPDRPGPSFWGRLVADALAGLHYAHELRDFDGSPLHIIHRDVSPHNLFVTYEGEVKLVDFGIAKAALSSGEVTEAGLVKGKLAYMAPEQALGQPMDRRADVFAMGVVLWELLAGQRLWHADTPAATLQKLLQEPIPPLAGLVPGLDARLEAVCMRALEKDPARRYPTAGLFREELEAALEGLSPRAPRRDELARTIQALFAEERAKVEERIQQMMRSAQDEDLDLDVTVEGEPLAPALPSLVTPASRKQHTNPFSRSGPAGGGARASDAVPRAIPDTAARVQALTGPSTPEPESLPAGRAPGTASTRGVVLAGVSLALVLLVGAAALVGRRDSGTRPPAAVAVAESPAPPSAPLDPEATGELVLRICGSNTVGAELMPTLVESFLRQKGASEISRVAGLQADQLYISAQVSGRPRPQLIRIDAQGSATAFTGLAARTCDLGMASRPVKDDEAEKLTAAGLGDVRLPGGEHVLALDGIAVIVHPANPVRELTVEQLQGIFSGRIEDWSEVGGATGPIRLYARDDRSGTFDTFQNLVLHKDKLSGGAKRYEDSNKLSDDVAGDPSGIGFIGVAYVRNAKALAIASGEAPPTFPSAFTVNTESYPLARRLYLYTPVGTRVPMMSNLVGFALSPAGQEAVRAQGFVDLSVEAQVVEACTRCSPKYRQLVKRARRLSLDFRFRADGDTLDSRGQRDLERLVLFLRSHSGKRLLLLGFSDAGASPAASHKLSLEWARRVGAELSARGVHAVEVRGFGAEMPVAPNTDPAGRERNRRVEVWLEG